jgi:hypothetical protein
MRYFIIYPCLCLCFGVDLQITKTFPLRRTTLHFMQIVLTDAFTFISNGNLYKKYQPLPRYRRPCEVNSRPIIR